MENKIAEVENMDIYEVLERLTGYLDYLVEWTGLDADDEVLEYIGAIENRIYKFVREHAPREGF
jgi:hypothetical protein